MSTKVIADPFDYSSKEFLSFCTLYDPILTKPVYTYADFPKVLGMCRQTGAKLVEAGLLKFIPVGTRNKLFPRHCILEFLYKRHIAIKRR